MSKYTAEFVEAEVEVAMTQGKHGTAAMFREFAALLRERESVKPVAWLDMGKGEAQLVFSKKVQSNRAAKKEAIRLFEYIPEGYHPLFLHPLMQSAKAPVTDEMAMKANHIYASYVGGGIESMRAALEAVASMLVPKQNLPSDDFIQNVPDKCDRIIWREKYYSLPMLASARVLDGWRDAMERALPFLDDEAAKYENDGSNEPLDVADTIRALLATAPKPEKKE